MKITTKQNPLSPFSPSALLLACLGEMVGGVVFPVIMAACALLSLYPSIHPSLSFFLFSSYAHYTDHVLTLSLTHTHTQWESCEVMI